VVTRDGDAFPWSATNDASPAAQCLLSTLLGHSAFAAGTVLPAPFRSFVQNRSSLSSEPPRAAPDPHRAVAPDDGSAAVSASSTFAPRPARWARIDRSGAKLYG
jgi:hypothetical protein